MRFGLPETTIEKIGGVFRAHPEVESAVVYGSRAKGNYRNGSDIDLTLHGAALTNKTLMDLMVELDDLLLPHTIDLSIFSALEHPGLREHIERVGQVFYERDSFLPAAEQNGLPLGKP
jgi:predicted nucleotidyltransferase